MSGWALFMVANLTSRLLMKWSYLVMRGGIFAGLKRHKR